MKKQWKENNHKLTLLRQTRSKRIVKEDRKKRTRSETNKIKSRRKRTKSEKKRN